MHALPTFTSIGSNNTCHGVPQASQIHFPPIETVIINKIVRRRGAISIINSMASSAIRD